MRSRLKTLTPHTIIFTEVCEKTTKPYREWGGQPIASSPVYLTSISYSVHYLADTKVFLWQTVEEIVL